MVGWAESWSKEQGRLALKVNRKTRNLPVPRVRGFGRARPTSGRFRVNHQSNCGFSWPCVIGDSSCHWPVEGQVALSGSSPLGNDAIPEEGSNAALFSPALNVVTVRRNSGSPGMTCKGEGTFNLQRPRYRPQTQRASLNVGRRMLSVECFHFPSSAALFPFDPTAKSLSWRGSVPNLL